MAEQNGIEEQKIRLLDSIDTKLVWLSVELGMIFLVGIISIFHR